MCGIAGIASRTARSLEAIFAMNESQSHRGPDGEGFLFTDGADVRHGFVADEQRADAHGTVAFGHRRLAILDTSDAGLQPMANRSEDVWLIHNGEIYNYLELRDELDGLGHQFRTGTDTEVVLAAYDEWGTAAFDRFNGMWAVALWDARTQRLVLSRDRFGIKPLHYALTDDSIVFASEIKAVLASGRVRARLNRPVALQYLRWSNVQSSDETMFEGIRSFPPGHTAVIDPMHPSTWRPQPFYALSEAVDPSELSMDEASDEFRERFLSSVGLRMRSDVPVGSCLSGGLDSSSIVCVAADGAGGSLNTFTSTFDDPRVDETKWSDDVNTFVGATPHLVFPKASGFAEELFPLIWHQEEPFGSTSIYAQWCLMREARTQGVPVLLDGQGGDEILCGYRKYYMFYVQSLLRDLRVLAAVREGVALARHGDSSQWNLRSGMRYLPAAFRERIWQIDSCLRPDAVAAWRESDGGVGLAGGSVTDRQVADVTRLSVPALLRYEDRNSMAWSIEARVPFLDHELVEFAVGLPIEHKLQRGMTKSVLRSALRGRVPSSVLDRRNKLGFATPMVDWLAGDLRSLVHDRFSRSDFAAAPIFDRAKVLDAFDAKSAEADAVALPQLFRILVFDAWAERFDVSI